MSETMADFEKEIEASFRKLNEGDVLEAINYKDEGSATTGLGALLAGLKLD